MNLPPLLCSSSILPPLRLINAVVVLSRVAAGYGVGLEALLEGSGIVPEDLTDPQKLITVQQEMTVMRTMGRILRDVPWIGLEVGKDYHFSANGKLGLAMMCSETLMDALALALEFIHLTNAYHQYTLKIVDGTGYGEFRALTDLGDIRQAVCEAEVSSMFSMANLGHVGPSVFRELRFAYPKPDYAVKYEELFQCPVIFSAPVHTIVFDPSHLSMPLKLANPLVRKAMEKDCMAMLPLLQQHETLAGRICRELQTGQDSFATLETLALRIHMSPRTLRRRLTDEGTSYNAILSDIRKERAVALLKTTHLSMESVASRLGFSEVSSFYRAFKLWTGLTPKKFREKEWN